jgi:two-component system phosphate regulon sensor histidine kinase PhoR
VTFVLVVVAITLAAALVAAIPIARSRIRDVAAEREQMRRELQTKIDALQRQRAIDLRILNGLGEGVLAVDQARRVVLANRRFAELFNVEEPVGKPIHDVLRIAAVFDGFDRALAGAESVERFATRSGIAERTIEMRALPLASEDITAVAVFIDVTRLERLEAMRRNFISDFSHEVRTPLAGLRSAVETHEDVERLTDGEAKQLRRIMARQLSRLERLVEELSELSRIESGEAPLARERIDLRKMIDELCEDFSDRAAQHRIDFVVSGGDVFVRADPLRIQQALSNLVDNAMKYGGDGKPIEISVAERGATAEIRVTDHGEGIDEREREKVFRRFYRIDKSRSQETGGTGLGLAITKHIILQHQGTIEIDSEIGRGSTFIVRLPVLSS